MWLVMSIINRKWGNQEEINRIRNPDLNDIGNLVLRAKKIKEELSLIVQANKMTKISHKF